MTSIKRPTEDLFAEQHLLAQPGAFTILYIQAEFSIPEVSGMCITFIRNSSNPRDVTLKITQTINHLHLSAWHFGKIQQFYKKKMSSNIWLESIWSFFFLVCFYGAKVQKKAQLLFNENSRQCFAQTENSSPIPIWKTWILKTQSLFRSHSTFYSNCKHSGYQLFEELKQNFNLKLT